MNNLEDKPRSASATRDRHVTVDLGTRSYDIHIGAGLLQRADVLALVAGRPVIVVTNDVVGPIYGDVVRRALGGNDVSEFRLADGEANKTMASWQSILDAMFANRLGRDAVVVALGGGVVGDMAGFAAASYQRGIDYIQVPTTLLAQVDSSVGGKTAVNHPAGKNMVGAFHQPIAVIADVDTLTTLPMRELRAGLAEVIKYGVIWDSAFFDWLEQNMSALLARDSAALNYAITRSCETKAEVVAADEREGGLRAILNYGHTFGHAIEHLLGYGDWLHGEAVGCGMVMAADLAQRHGTLNTVESNRIKRLVAQAGLPVAPPAALSAEAMMQSMGMDKKVRAGRINLILPTALGQVEVTDEFDVELLRRTLGAGEQLCLG